jgi:hypothetical protein
VGSVLPGCGGRQQGLDFLEPDHVAVLPGQVQDSGALLFERRDARLQIGKLLVNAVEQRRFLGAEPVKD